MFLDSPSSPYHKASLTKVGRSGSVLASSNTMASTRCITFILQFPLLEGNFKKRLISPDCLLILFLYLSSGTCYWCSIIQERLPSTTSSPGTSLCSTEGTRAQRQPQHTVSEGLTFRGTGTPLVLC